MGSFLPSPAGICFDPELLLQCRLIAEKDEDGSEEEIRNPFDIFHLLKDRKVKF